MIEMRWLRRWELHPVDAYVSVLQYRQTLHYLGADGSIHISHSRGNVNWSDWIDVPTVTENQQGN